VLRCPYNGRADGSRDPHPKMACGLDIDSINMVAQQTLLGTCVGNYRLVRTIGRGSMGEVFEAEHVLVGRRVAVKVLLPELCSYPEVANRFFNEARAVATMHHPGIVQLFDFGLHAEGSAFIVMELIDGETLAEMVNRRGPLPVAEAVDIARQVAEAMASAHACGVVHRDLKPENIVLARDAESGSTRVKVLDFGIAKLDTSSLLGVSATRTGQILGTPAFMAPEQCHGASRVDDRSDIYALGCVIYFMLTGRPPFVSDGVGATIAAHMYLRPVKPSTYSAGIPAGVESLIMRLLAKLPEDRPSTMGKAAELLAAALAADATDEPYEISITTNPRVSAQARAATEPMAVLPSLSARESTRESTRASVAPGRGRSVPRWRLGAAACGVVAIATFAPTSWRTPDADEPGAWETMRPVLPALAGLVAEAPDLPVPAPADVHVAALPAPTGARTITVRVVSRPAGAEVARASDGKRLGVTPLDLEIPVGGKPIALRVHKLGFVGEAIELPADRDGQVAVVLTARPRLQATNVVARRPKLSKPVKDGALDPFGD